MIAQAAATTAVNAYLMAAVIGFATYVETGGNLKAAALAMASAGIASGIGSAFGTGALTSSQIFAKALLHGLSQGVLTQAGGGRFGDGFIGGFTSGLMELSAIKNFMPKSGLGKAIASAIVGGTLSKIGGGKFANGAYHAAIVHLFNWAQHNSASEERKLPDGVKKKNDNVKIDKLDAKIFDKLSDVKATFTEKGHTGDVVITSGNDSTHGSDSLHYTDKAIDIRTNFMTDTQQQTLADALQVKLGDGVTVISEHFENSTSNHIHIEVDKPADATKASVYKDPKLKRELN
jgi:hypothetical protein